MTAIANTKILTLIGNTFVDASGTNTTITTAGSPTLINDRVVTINQAITTTIDGTTLSVSNIYTNFLYANNAAGNTGQLLAANSTGGIFWTSVVGYTGSTGFTGSVGFVGSKGDLGYTGSRGIDGVIGYDGSLGYTGSQGSGYTGSAGPQGVSVYVSATAPVAPANGDVWWNTNLGSLFIYYDDGDTSQWVSAAPSAGVITPTADPFNQFLLAGM